MTALLFAARYGRLRVVEHLIQAGAEIEAKCEAFGSDQNEGMTALLFAARYGHLRVAEFLIQAGADIEAKSETSGSHENIRFEKGRTPLIWAAAGRDCPQTQDRMCRLLLDKGADVHARNCDARTALQEAAMSAREYNVDPRATMELLLQRGAYVNAYDVNGWTALMECAHYGSKELAELLLVRGAHVDGRPGQDDPSMNSNPDLHGKPYETTLFVCAELSWNEELICLLLNKGADIEGKNKHGKTIQELASDAKRGIVLDELDRVRELRKSP